jgi:hypothetical protein
LPVSPLHKRKLDFSPSTDLVVYNNKDGAIQRSLTPAGQQKSIRDPPLLAGLLMILLSSLVINLLLDKTGRFRAAHDWS